jgi:hypothetical protein
LPSTEILRRDISLAVRVKDRVRLVREVEGLPAGSEGVVFGFLRRPDGEKLTVSFAGGRSLILEPEDVELVEELPEPSD